MEYLNILLDEHYKGQTFTEKLHQKMMKHMLEAKYEIFGYTPRIMESPLVVVHTTEKYPELKGVSTSPILKDKCGKCVADLLLDNFGFWFAGTFGGQVVTLQNLSGANRLVETRSANVSVFNTTSSGAVGMRYQIGADPTAVARTDVDIGIPFASGPQANRFVGGGAGWTSGGGIIQAPASVVTAISAGIIEECGLFGRWLNQTTGGLDNFMLAHDNISSLPFLAGETINITESFTL